MHMKPDESNPDRTAGLTNEAPSWAGAPVLAPHGESDAHSVNISTDKGDALSPAPRQRTHRVETNQRFGYDLTEVEPFVKPEVAAWYLDIDPATVVRFAAEGLIPGHPLRDKGKRSHWRFLLSEIRENMVSQAGTEIRSDVRK